MRRWHWISPLLLLGMVTACLPASGGSGSAPAMPVIVLESPPAPGAVDQMTLWTRGTLLRGANIWQRIVVPDLDGPEFLGDGHVGPPYIQSDFDSLAALGANVVNLSVPGLFTERPPYVLDEQVQENLDNLIAMAAEADLFVVITFRTGPGRSDFTFYRDGAGDWFDPSLLIESVWEDPQAQAAWEEMWQAAALRYRDNPVVAGYDLMCEPNPDDVALGIYEPSEFYPQYAGSTYDWNQFYPRIVSAIREVDPDTPILVSAMGWGDIRWLPWLQPVDDDRIVYTFHQYAPHPYTHNDPPSAQISYPGHFDTDYDGDPEAFNLQWLEAYLEPAADFASEHGVPLAVNEFGVQRWQPGAAEFMLDEIALFEQYGWNHALWVWDPEWEPWTGQVTDFNFRMGPDPRSTTEVDNALLQVISSYWQRNQLRPSNFQP